MIREYIAKKYQNGQDDEARTAIIFELKQDATMTDQGGETVEFAEVSEPTEAEIAAAETEYYASRRSRAYGSPVAQMEYITEHGLEAWQSRVAEIKAEFSKPVQE